MSTDRVGQTIRLGKLVVADRLAGMRNKEIADKYHISRVAVGCYLRRAIRRGEVTAEALRLRRWSRPDRATLDQRWIERVKGNCDIPPSGCWIWKGYQYNNGYGMTSYDGKNVTVHRQMYGIVHGVKIDRWIYVCHRCDVKLCCNPDHLWLGTPKQNSQDSAIKGRHQEGRKTECHRGHPLSGDNVRISLQKNGTSIRRVCLTCEQINHSTPEYKARAAARQRQYKARLRTQTQQVAA